MCISFPGEFNDIPTWMDTQMWYLFSLLENISQDMFPLILYPSERLRVYSFSLPLNCRPTQKLKYKLTVPDGRCCLPAAVVATPNTQPLWGIVSLCWICFIYCLIQFPNPTGPHHHQSTKKQGKVWGVQQMEEPGNCHSYEDDNSYFILCTLYIHHRPLYPMWYGSLKRDLHSLHHECCWLDHPMWRNHLVLSKDHLFCLPPVSPHYLKAQ